jgi:MYXO-CTERM domain-containing protein
LGWTLLGPHVATAQEPPQERASIRTCESDADCGLDAGSDGAPGEIDDDGGPGANGSGGSASVAGGTGGRNPLDYCGVTGVIGTGSAMGSGGVWSGTGGSASVANGTGGSGVSSEFVVDAPDDGADHVGSANGFGCAVSEGAASASWFGLVGLLGMGLRLRARRRER